jgi:UDP-N-acetylmuramate dehydrogenase
VPLAPLTTLRVGGPAARLITVTTEMELLEAVRTHPEAFVLGGGSNVVLPDRGLDEVVLIRTTGISGQRVEAGEDWDAFVEQTVDDGLAGLEVLSGIPGTVGASPIQNIGAYGGEVSSFIQSVRAYDRSRRQVVVLPAEACGFSYRHSTFKAELRNWVILSVTFDLPTGQQSGRLAYAELADALGVELGRTVPTRAVREAVLHLRRTKGMVLDPTDPDSVSAGSFFTNPIVTEAPEGAPSWPAPGGKVKVSAAWLIQQSGFDKGYGEGRVGLSSKHTLALVNRGGGTAEELIDLARSIRNAVRARFGITLVPEPVLVGSVL